MSRPGACRRPRARASRRVMTIVSPGSSSSNSSMQSRSEPAEQVDGVLVAERADERGVLDERAEVLPAGGHRVVDRRQQVGLADAEAAVEVDAGLELGPLLRAAEEAAALGGRRDARERHERLLRALLRRVCGIRPVGLEGRLVELRRRHEARHHLGARDLRLELGEVDDPRAGGCRCHAVILCRTVTERVRACHATLPLEDLGSKGRGQPYAVSHERSARATRGAPIVRRVRHVIREVRRVRRARPARHRRLAAGTARHARPRGRRIGRGRAALRDGAHPGSREGGLAHRAERSRWCATTWTAPASPRCSAARASPATTRS